MQPTIISLLGKPLAGKDTVAGALREQFSDIATISMGDVIREVKSTGSQHRFWQQLKESVAVGDSGGIAPDAPVFDCLKILAEEKLAEGHDAVVWVAGPRTLQQLGWLDDWTKEKGFREVFIHIDVPDAEVYKRLEGRNNGREDDKVPHVRLQNFRDITKPVIDHLRQEGRLLEINGVGNREAVQNRTIEALTMRKFDPEITLPAMARR